MHGMLRADLGDDAYLRLFEERDVDELHAAIEANRAHLARWLPWAVVQTRADTAQYVARSRRQLAESDGTSMAIVAGGAIVGAIGFHAMSTVHRNATLGYWLAAAAQGRGLMTRAVAACVDHAFGPWGLHRVEIRAATGNARSRAIPLRLGFREEGVLRHAEWVEDRWVDHVVYGRLATDPAPAPARR
jgi:ribosomal-protein-serine acetyltransferase